MRARAHSSSFARSSSSSSSSSGRQRRALGKGHRVLIEAAHRASRGVVAATVVEVLPNTPARESLLLVGARRPHILGRGDGERADVEAEVGGAQAGAEARLAPAEDVAADVALRLTKVENPDVRVTVELHSAGPSIGFRTEHRQRRTLALEPGLQIGRATLHHELIAHPDRRAGRERHKGPAQALDHARHFQLRLQSDDCDGPRVSLEVRRNIWVAIVVLATPA
mmetsp:Transcript_64484/g.209281  ORF Transcript_64484/g.209281 Transcript_64484/m.209281 type:complete len:224 (+) Transcript_64484:59-730(+)